jgi:hypothetical protein
LKIDVSVSGLSDLWEGFKADPSLMIAIFENKINGGNSQERNSVIEFHRQVM